ncbi:MAG: HDIG domain-containing metalloprotein [Planctomycetota bacterium]
MPPASTSSGSKGGSRSGTRSRRRVAVRRQSLTTGELASMLTRSPEFGWALVIGVAFVTLVTTVTAWSRSQPLVAIDQPARSTVTARVPVETVNLEATRSARDQAQYSQPRVYDLDTQGVAAIFDPLRRLPLIAAEAGSVAAMPAWLGEGLDQTAFELLTGFAREDGSIDTGWLERMDAVQRRLELRPILLPEEYASEQASIGRQILLLTTEGEALASAAGVIELGSEPQLRAAGREIGRAAQLPPALHGVVGSRLLTTDEPTARLNSSETQARQLAAAEAVPEQVDQTPPGAVIVRAGEPVSGAQLRLLEQEASRYAAAGPCHIRALEIAGLVTLSCFGALTLGGYVGAYMPRIRRNPGRMAALAGLVLAGVTVTAAATVAGPSLRGLTIVAPLVFTAAVLTIAYEARLAMIAGTVQASLALIALREPALSIVPMLTGIGAAAWQLSELRDRGTLIRAGLTIGLSVALPFAGVMLVMTPTDSPAYVPAAFSTAAWAGLGGVLVMGLVLFILPSLERMFDITTGMTLIELRDPKQPLLRELQRRAPGTYNHSLNVASISEQAADAIGANPLLTYAGVLYHDIGKMNKPEYFVENQSGGRNKHDKLSPAMSLLVIVGHVKDGLELAREFGLPRPLYHFIEAHHGTTLVEYFYERARQRADAQELESGSADDRPEEVEYRYPGPKPQTREVAIVMIADAVESATRTMADPTPSRIENLVHSIARKRLEDGQFDECGLTLRDLHIITESIAKSVTAIYHGRVAYPSAAKA